MRILLFLLLIGLVACADSSKSKEVDTKEMIKLLRVSNINSVSTSHSNSISLRTKEGKHYWAEYFCVDAPEKYSHICDAANLVSEILLGERGLSPEKDFGFSVE